MGIKPGGSGIGHSVSFRLFTWLDQLKMFVKAFIVVSLALAAFLVAGQSMDCNQVVECPPPNSDLQVFHPNVYNCSSYYLCSNGMAISK